MGVRLANAAVYGALSVFAVAALARPLVPAVRALLQPYSYAPGLAWPWVWPLLAAGLLLVVADGTRRLVAGRPIGMQRYGLVLILGALSLGAVRFVHPPTRPVAADGLGHLVARVEATASAAWSRDRRYPVEPARYEEAWPARLRDLGFRRRGGLPLLSRLHVLEGAGPALRAPPQVRPGDVVMTLDRDARRYWITAFHLDRRGRLAPIGDRRGRAHIAAAVEGRPSSRLDPLFPEYPNRLPLRAAPQEDPSR